ncbi:MAG TPA: P-loop NTPase [Polyangia bacterium]|nr:P-loop NTPase [Polyangia bacterium]
MSRPIRIAVASGKGGTGKTTIATNLAVVLAEAGVRAAYVDCDVEEPNGHIFLAPAIRESRRVSIPVPAVDESKCTYCGACGTACRYSAILMLPKTILTFPKLCHGCGGCTLACPTGAIREVPREIGAVEEGDSGEVVFLQGRLDVGEAMAPPVIRAVLGAATKDRVLVLDAPPGTSCPVIESVKTADVVLLVTEPTPFGLNDLKLAVEMVRELGVPFGVAVNRVGTGDGAVFEYCAAERIPVLIEIPNDREIARAYSRGELATRALPWLKPQFAELYRKLSEFSRSGPSAHVAPGRRIAPEEGTSGPLPSEELSSGEQPDVRELVVISGKGGTGKTSIVASFFALAERAAVADCDVDAADLHLVLDPTVRRIWPFSGGKTAVIDEARCTGCGECATHCRFGAVHVHGGKPGPTFEVDAVGCEGCGVCVDMCPEKAIELVSSIGGGWFISDTRHGPMAHARLGVAQENSGKLVSLVRREGKALAVLERRDLLICDGSPGIGCPVIASLTGARYALVVTEPTLSGLHDLERVAELTRQFHVETGICINKADINSEISTRIEAAAAARGIPVLGRVRYDDAVTSAQVRRKAVVEDGNGPAAQDIRALWARVRDAIG